MTDGHDVRACVSVINSKIRSVKHKDTHSNAFAHYLRVMNHKAFTYFLIALFVLATIIAAVFYAKWTRCENEPVTSIDRVDSLVINRLSAESKRWSTIADSLQYAVNERDFFIDSILDAQPSKYAKHLENRVRIRALAADDKLQLLSDNLSKEISD